MTYGRAFDVDDHEYAAGVNFVESGEKLSLMTHDSEIDLMVYYTSIIVIML